MKKLLLFFPALLIGLWSYGQCEPMADFGDQPYGVEPDTDVNFVDGEVNSIYSQQIDVKVPEDGGFAGAPFIMVDSAKIVSIDGLPPGLSLECNGNATLECMYLAGTVGCGIISGIPNMAGTYDLVINLSVYTSIGPQDLPFTGYQIFIDGPNGIASSPNLNFNLSDARPNPAHAKATIQIDTKKPGEGLFRVFDMVGKEVYSRDLSLNQGVNKVEYTTADLPEGVYIYRIDAFGETMTSRLVIVH